MVHIRYLQRGRLEEWRSDPARLQSHPALPPSRTRRAGCRRQLLLQFCYEDGELGLREFGNWPIQLRRPMGAIAHMAPVSQQPLTSSSETWYRVTGSLTFPDLQKASAAPCGRGQDEEEARPARPSKSALWTRVC